MDCLRAQRVNPVGTRVMLLVASAIVIGVAPGYSQDNTNIAPVPLVTGYIGFNTTFEPGTQTFNPVLAPIVLAPIGKRLLVEGEFEMESEIQRTEGGWGDHAIDKGIDYLQVDYLASAFVTVAGGRFLTPFGIFNERLHPAWIKNLMVTPLVFGLSANSSVGGMIRGGIPINKGAVLNYAAYYAVPYSSENATLKMMNSDRAAGGRWSVFLAEQRLETGFSFKRELGIERSSAYGGDFTWNIRSTPLDLRAEYARSEHGHGYWFEGAYRTVDVPVLHDIFSRSQLVARIEQFHVPESGLADMDPQAAMAPAEQGHAELPDVDTTRPMIGWNYYVHDALKFSVGYGRSITSDGSHNLWSMGVAYRFGS